MALGPGSRTRPELSGPSLACSRCRRACPPPSSPTSREAPCRRSSNILLALRHRDLTGEEHISISPWRTRCSRSHGSRLRRVSRPGGFPGVGENMLAGASPRYALYDTAESGSMSRRSTQAEVLGYVLRRARSRCRIAKRRRGPCGDQGRDPGPHPVPTGAGPGAICSTPSIAAAPIVSSLDEACRDEHSALGGCSIRMSMPGMPACRQLRSADRFRVPGRSGGDPPGPEPGPSIRRRFWVPERLES